MIGDLLVPVRVPDVPQVWPLVADMIDAAYAALDEPTPDVRSWLLEGKGILWVLFRSGRIIAASTTLIGLGRQGRIVRVVTVGGSQADWKGCISRIEQYAAAEGCYKVAIDGRRGWERVLPDYAPVCVSYEKRI